jgi:hypothetical protein
MRFVCKRLAIATMAVVALGVMTAASASATEWQVRKGGTWGKVTETTPVTGSYNVELTLTEFPYEGSGFKCENGSYKGNLLGNNTLQITSAENGAQCKTLGHCEVTPASESRNFPWAVEFYTEGTESRLRFAKGTNGWPTITLSCRVGGIEERFECKLNTTLKYSNVLGVFVETRFDAKSPKVECGASKGEEKGSFVTVKPKSGTGVEAIRVQ